MSGERQVPVSDLVGAAEIADRLGLSHPQAVHTLRQRNADFPAPIARLRTALIWSWADVESWARTTGRLPSPADTPHRTDGPPR
ncbi:MAG: DNA-binding protein [Acidimicrobiia bacterium]